MQSVGIKGIKANPGVISKAIEANEYLLISKRGKPIAIATALDDAVFDLLYLGCTSPSGLSKNRSFFTARQD